MVVCANCILETILLFVLIVTAAWCWNSVSGTRNENKSCKKTIRLFGLITITAPGHFYPSISFCSIAEDDIHDKSTLWGLLGVRSKWREWNG